MTRTFLVAVNLAGSEDLTMVAAEIEDSLLTDGITVTSVKPWASAITETATGLDWTHDSAAPSSFQFS